MLVRRRNRVWTSTTTAADPAASGRILALEDPTEPPSNVAYSSEGRPFGPPGRPSGDGRATSRMPPLQPPQTRRRPEPLRTREPPHRRAPRCSSGASLVRPLLILQSSQLLQEGLELEIDPRDLPSYRSVQLA